jgi:lipopolysaccharide export system permease protein
MTLGNLAENNELTALKSSGLSLFRIIKPLFVVIIVIATATFYFSNYIIPVANLKMRALIYDIQETKIAKIVTPGTYSTEIDGYAIKVEENEKGGFKNIVIHDHSNPNINKTVKATVGDIYNGKNGAVLYLNLKNGNVLEELAINQNENFESRSRGRYYPSRRISFENAVYQIDLTGFKLNRSDEDLFKNSYEMLNVFQMDKAIDSIRKNNRGIIHNFLISMKNEHPFFMVKPTISSPTILDTFPITKVNIPEKKDAKYKLVLENAIAKTRKMKEIVEGQKSFIDALNTSIKLYKIEYHRKYALTFAILVLFFVGAPLGAIIKKGGFGAPVVIACLLFMIYFVLTELGEGLVNSNTVSPILGMWLATLVLLPVAYLLMRSAAKDSKVFDTEAWIKFFKRKKK